MLALSRQSMPTLANTTIEGVAKGAYVIHDTSSSTKPDVILMGTGSELHLAHEAALLLEKEGKNVSAACLFAAHLILCVCALYVCAPDPIRLCTCLKADAATLVNT